MFSICLLAMSSFAASDTFSGRWSIKTNIAGHDSEATCSFTEKQSELSGSCETEQGHLEITGKVDGKKISWHHASEYNGTPLTVLYSGTADSDSQLTGTIDVRPIGATGTFTGNKMK